jgi:hypothetical protein
MGDVTMLLGLRMVLQVEWTILHEIMVLFHLSSVLLLLELVGPLHLRGGLPGLGSSLGSLALLNVLLNL